MAPDIHIHGSFATCFQSIFSLPPFSWFMKKKDRRNVQNRPSVLLNTAHAGQTIAPSYDPAAINLWEEENVK
jgi:hypothetical protein